MADNLYGKKFRTGFYNGSFTRCPHGHTGLAKPCGWCGLWHPVRYILHLLRTYY